MDIYQGLPAGRNSVNSPLQMAFLLRAAQCNTKPRFTRFLQTQVSAQAYLEPLESHPGITCLSLNRPQSRNAISMTLLQVNIMVDLSRCYLLN